MLSVQAKPCIGLVNKMSPPWKLEVSLHESPANANRLHFGWVGRWSTFNVYRKSSKFCWTHGTVEKLILQFYIPPSFGGQGQYVVYITAQSTSLRAKYVDGVRPAWPLNSTAFKLLFPAGTNLPVPGDILAIWSGDAELAECSRTAEPLYLMWKFLCTFHFYSLV